MSAPLVPLSLFLNFRCMYSFCLDLYLLYPSLYLSVFYQFNWWISKKDAHTHTLFWHCKFSLLHQTHLIVGWKSVVGIWMNDIDNIILSSKFSQNIIFVPFGEKKLANIERNFRESLNKLLIWILSITENRFLLVRFLTFIESVLNVEFFRLQKNLLDWASRFGRTKFKEK